MFEIDSTSLGQWFDVLADGGATSGREERNAILLAKDLWNMSLGEADFETQDNDFGHCRLWVRVADGLPSKVAIVRRTGMLITTRQRGLLRFPGFRDFVALCVFEDPHGNELLRRMENPKHDQFEPDRLSEGERDRGRRALNRIVKWIREAIRKTAGPPPGGKRTVLAELATYLPDLQPEEAFEDGASGSEERGGAGIRRSGRGIVEANQASQATDIAVRGTGAREMAMVMVRRTDSRGVEGAEPTGALVGPVGKEKGKVLVVLERAEAVGVLRRFPFRECGCFQWTHGSNRYRLSFDADGEGVVRLVLEEAGDSITVRRGDIRSASDDLSLESVRIERGCRTVLEVTADAPIRRQGVAPIRTPAKGRNTVRFDPAKAWPHTPSSARRAMETIILALNSRST